jgi:peptide/nickel transport system permease protein
VTAASGTLAATVAAPDVVKRRGHRPLYRRLARSAEACVALAILLAIALSAICADWIAPADPLAQDITQRFRPPAWEDGGSPANLLGTDAVGRDLLSRLIYGGRISLAVGLAAVLVQGGLGVLLGLVAGFYGQRPDALIMRLADIQLAIPTLILAIAVIAVLGPSLTNLIIVLGITNWVIYGRVVRGEVLSVRRREFVEAARVLGGRDARVIFRHVLPNVTASIVVIATLEVAQMIIAEASLSFLGLGVQPPTPTWGGMVAEGRTYIATRWWLSAFPGVMILLTVLALNLFGDWLRDVLDPTLRAVES